MTFVTTGLAIAGLLAIAIPIIIHLLSRRRRKPIEWGAMRFLLEAFRRQRKRLRIEQMLLLATRCLILALLGMALAQPILQATGILDTGGGRRVYFVIDNGMASGVLRDNGEPALDEHIEQAVQTIRALNVSDAVGVILAARPARGLVVPPSTDHAAVIRTLRELEPQHSPTDIPAAMNLLKLAVDRDESARSRHVVYLLSDFRSGSVALDAPLPALLDETAQRTTLLASPPAEQTVDNVQVVAVEPRRRLIVPGIQDGSGQVTVRLKRAGTALERAVSTVRLVGDNLAPIPPKTVNWEPGQSEANVDFIAEFEGGGDRRATLTAVIDNDALEADNDRHEIVELRDEVRVVVLDRRAFGVDRSIEQLTAGQWMRRALQPFQTSPLDVIEVDPTSLDVADLRLADVVLMPRPDLVRDDAWPLIREYVDGGGLLVITPPADVNIHQWADTMVTALDLPWQLALEAVEHEEPQLLADEQPPSNLLRMVSNDLGELSRPIVVLRTLPVDDEQTQAERILMFADGTPAMIVGSPALERPEADDDRQQDLASSRGRVAYLAFAPKLAWSNLPTQPLMVPLMNELVRQGLSQINAAVEIDVGERPALGANPSAASVQDEQGEQIVLDRRGRPIEPLTEAGVYNVLDVAGKPIDRFAVNVDVQAGRTDAQSNSAVDAWLGESGEWSFFDTADPAAALRTASRGSPLAGWLLGIVLLLVILETAMARWFSHAERSRATDTLAGGIAPTLSDVSSGMRRPGGTGRPLSAGGATS